MAHRNLHNAAPEEETRNRQQNPFRPSKIRQQGEAKRFYQQLNHIRKDFKPRTTMCRDKYVNLLMNKEAMLNRWVEHFQDLLVNQQHQTTTEDSTNFCKAGKRCRKYT